MSRLGWMVVMLMAAGTVAAAERPKKETPPPKQEEEGVMDPKADAALRKMGTYLAGLKSFTVESESVDEKVTTDGQKIQELKSSKITVQRPAELRVDRIGPAGRATLRADGKQVSLFSETKNVYAMEPAELPLDTVIDALRDKLHVDAPGGDLLVSQPYRDLVDGVIAGRYVGLEPVDGVMAHHLAMTEKDVDWQIWIAEGEKAVPLRYVITSKDMAGAPQFTLRMTNWEPNAAIAPDTFSFTPPPNAKRIEFNVPRPESAAAN